MNPAKMTRAVLGFATMLALVCGLTTGSAFAANMTITQGAAHASHTQDNRALAKLSCAECHAPVCSPTGSRNVVFGAMAATGGTAPTWNATARTCSNVYCHGSSPAPVAWTYVYTPVAPTLAVECAMCHGYPPSSHEASSTSCNGCHSETVKTDGTIDIAGGKHINGTLEVSGGTGGTGCAACHGFPPATGAHVAHFGPTGITTISYVDTGTLEDRYPECNAHQRTRGVCVRLRQLPLGDPRQPPERLGGRETLRGGRTGRKHQGPQRQHGDLRRHRQDLQRGLLPLQRPGFPDVRRNAGMELRHAPRLHGLPRQSAALRLGRCRRGHRQQPPEHGRRRIRVRALPRLARPVAHQQARRKRLGAPGRTPRP